MISASDIKTIYDLLRDLIGLRKERIGRRMDLVYQPMFDLLVKIHTDYERIFYAAYTRIPTEWRDCEDSASFVDTEGGMRILLKEIKNQFSDARRLNRGDRDRLRGESKEVFSAVSTDYERRFLGSVIIYFLENEPAAQSDEIHDFLIESVLRKGPDELRTPSELVEKDLDVDGEPCKFYRVLKEAADKANQRYVDASRMFIALKLNAIEET